MNFEGYLVKENVCEMIENKIQHLIDNHLRYQVGKI